MQPTYPKEFLKNAKNAPLTSGVLIALLAFLIKTSHTKFQKAVFLNIGVRIAALLYFQHNNTVQAAKDEERTKVRYTVVYDGLDAYLRCVSLSLFNFNGTEGFVSLFITGMFGRTKYAGLPIIHMFMSLDGVSTTTVSLTYTLENICARLIYMCAVSTAAILLSRLIAEVLVDGRKEQLSLSSMMETGKEALRYSRGVILFAASYSLRYFVPYIASRLGLHYCNFLGIAASSTLFTYFNEKFNDEYNRSLYSNKLISDANASLTHKIMINIAFDVVVDQLLNVHLVKFTSKEMASGLLPFIVNRDSITTFAALYAMTQMFKSCFINTLTRISDKVNGKQPKDNDRIAGCDKLVKYNLAVSLAVGYTMGIGIQRAYAQYFTGGSGAFSYTPSITGIFLTAAISGFINWLAYDKPTGTQIFEEDLQHKPKLDKYKFIAYLDKYKGMFGLLGIYSVMLNNGAHISLEGQLARLLADLPLAEITLSGLDWYKSCFAAPFTEHLLKATFMTSYVCVLGQLITLDMFNFEKDDKKLVDCKNNIGFTPITGRFVAEFIKYALRSKLERYFLAGIDPESFVQRLLGAMAASVCVGIAFGLVMGFVKKEAGDSTILNVTKQVGLRTFDQVAYSVVDSVFDFFVPKYMNNVLTQTLITSFVELKEDRIDEIDIKQNASVFTVIKDTVSTIFNPTCIFPAVA